MPTIVRVAVALLVVLALASGSSACFSAPAEAGSSTATAAIVYTPIRLVIITDKSGSTLKTRTPQLTRDDVIFSIDALLNTGGELAIGAICTSSNGSFLRLRVPAPVPEPVVGPAPTNVFEKRNYERKVEELRAKQAERRRQTENDFNARRLTFLSALEGLLAQSPSCGYSDVVGALGRVDLFYQEPILATDWPTAPRNVAVLITDGQQTPLKEKVVFRASAELVLVNGSGVKGDLAHLNPAPFEGVEAALRYAVLQEGGGRVR